MSLIDPGELVDGDLYLVLEKAFPADEQRGWPPAVRFALHKVGKAEKAGEIGLGLGEPPPGYEDWLGPVRHKCVYHLKTG